MKNSIQHSTRSDPSLKTKEKGGFEVFLYSMLAVIVSGLGFGMLTQTYSSIAAVPIFLCMLGSWIFLLSRI